MTKDRWKKEAGEAIAAASRIVVLGVGNPDKGDDGAGVAAAAALGKRLSPVQKRRIRVLLGGSVPESLTGKIRAFGPRLVMILDAALGVFPPGTLFRVNPAKITDDGITTHRISLRWLVRYIEESMGCPVIVLGIQPKSLEFEGKLSTATQKGISTAVDFIVENLERPKHRSGRGIRSSSA